MIVLFGNKGDLGSYLENNIKNRKIIGVSRDNCNMESKEFIQKFLEGIADKYGKIDSIINAIGRIELGNFESTDISIFNKVMNDNVKVLYNILMASVPLLSRAGRGRFINISSIRGISGAPNKSIYSCSKYAVQGLIDSLRLEYKDSGIKFTNICSGLIGESVTKDDIVKAICFVLDLSDATYVRNIILGGLL